jgi:hypothetical protein
VSSGLLRRVALVRTDVSEEPSSSFIMVTRIGELEIALVTSSVVPSSPILVTLMKEVPPKRRFLQESHGVTSQKSPFFKIRMFNQNVARMLHIVSSRH